ncbi:hypothetical protein [Paenibacillus turpanensis]|uniref:hypothetical protein n=1 Tax=Paenibacillus turpanensis TaxID=2689078 RepID=UPI00140BD890|nr:hypothetical protein [Paenibacillus turpanensis]
MNSKAFVLMLLMLLLTSCEVNHSQLATSNDPIAQYKEENSQLQSRIKELEQEITRLSNKQPKKKSSGELSIDGSSLSIDHQDYILEYEGRTYVSADFMKEFYGVDDEYPPYLIFRGLPLEKKLIGINSIYNLSKEGLRDLTNTMSVTTKDEYSTIYQTDGLEIGFVEAGNYYVLTKPVFMNDRGISIGSSRSDVQLAYGKLGEDDSEVWSTFNSNAEYIGTKFTFKDHKVIKIVGTFN